MLFIGEFSVTYALSTPVYTIRLIGPLALNSFVFIATASDQLCKDCGINQDAAAAPRKLFLKHGLHAPRNSFQSGESGLSANARSILARSF